MARQFALSAIQQNAVSGLDAAVITNTITPTSDGQLKTTWTKYSFANADIVALGAVTTANVTLTSFPAKTFLETRVVIVTGQAAGVTTLTLNVGYTATAYTDFVNAFSLKSAVGTVSNGGGSIASATGATTVKLQFNSSGGNLDAVTGCSFDLFFETTVLP